MAKAKVLILTMISFISISCAGLPWSSSPSKSSTGKQPKVHPDELEVNHVHRLTEHLDAYMRRPDCFRDVASSIRSQCTNLETEQNERIQAAISLTLCELATAKQHSTPMECTPFDLRMGVVSFDQPESIQGQCVEAFSRSAQHWSSYSGYLREIPQLCFAFLRWNEIDTARNVYKEATAEHMSFLRDLKKSQDLRDRSDAVATEIIEDVKRAMSHLEASSIDFRHGFDNSMEYRQAREDEMFHEIQNTILGLQSYNEHVLQNWQETMNSTATSLTVQYISSTAAMVSTIQEELLARVDGWFSEAYEHYSNALQAANAFDQTLTHLSQNVEIVHQSVRKLSASAEEVASSLESQAIETIRMQEIQKNTMHTAESLSGALSELSQQTQAELSSINETAIALIDDLRSQKHLAGSLDIWKGWGRSSVFWLLEIVLRIHVDPENIDHLVQLPIFRFAGILSQFAWFLLQACFSSVMGMILCLFSARHWLPKIPIRPSNPSKSKYEESMLSTDEPHDSSPASHSFRAAPTVSRPRTRIRMSRIPQRLLDGSQ